MQDLIAAYLFQYKKCPLPGVGTLYVNRHEAVIVSGEKKILPPFSEITFDSKETEAADLVSYIAAEKEINEEEALYRLHKFSHALKERLHSTIRNVGAFEKNSDNDLIFTPVTPVNYYTEIHAERVVRTDSSHNMLVGDKETTTTAMTEYFTPSDAPRRSFWWIWALIIIAVSVGLIVLYMNDDTGTRSFGNAEQHRAPQETKTYSKLP